MNASGVLALAATALIQTAAAQPSSSLAIWGSDGGGTQDLPPDTYFSRTALSYNHNLGVTPDGLVVSWGARPLHPPPNATNVIDVAAGLESSAALRSDGTLVAWGLPALSDVIQRHHSMGEPATDIVPMPPP